MTSCTVDDAGQKSGTLAPYTSDGGHLELQALRYAAMVSAMTFADLVDHYERYLARVEPDAAGDARSRLADWLDNGEDTTLSREVRIVLVSAGFDREITTTVLWLTDVYGLDIRCMRLTPYKVADRLLLDVQHVIPLPEAAELTVQLRRRETQARAVRADNRDWTSYVINTPDGPSEPLRKRWAILAMVTALHRAGVTGQTLATVPRSRFLDLHGMMDGQDLTDAFVARYPGADDRPDRWFLDHPLHDADRTWVLSKMWGTATQRTLDRLVTLAPNERFGYQAIDAL